MSFFSNFGSLLGVSKRNRSKRSNPCSNRFLPSLELLEDRDLPSGVQWVPIGPGPLESSGYGFVGGHVNTIAFAPNIDNAGTNAAFIGGSTGGIWRSDNFTTNAPEWRPLTDGQSSIGSL